MEQFLEDGQAQDLAVVHLGRGAAPRDEFPFDARHAGFGQGVIERSVERGNEVFEVQRGTGGHGDSS